jgi:hypothetical protein
MEAIYCGATAQSCQLTASTGSTASGKHVAATVVLAVAAATAVGERSEGEHFIHMGVDELIELIRALLR